MNMMTAHPTLTMFAIGLAVSITMGIVIASLEQGSFAFAKGATSTSSNRR